MSGALTKAEASKIDRLFDASKAVVKTLAPLSGRAQRRIIGYLMDLVSDPDSGGSLAEVDCLRKVEETLVDLRR